MLPDLHTGFSRGRSGGLVFPSLSEFFTVYCDPHKGIGIVNKAEIDVFLELSSFFDDGPIYISGSFYALVVVVVVMTFMIKNFKAVM